LPLLDPVEKRRHAIVEPRLKAPEPSLRRDVAVEKRPISGQALFRWKFDPHLDRGIFGFQLSLEPRPRLRLPAVVGAGTPNLHWADEIERQEDRLGNHHVVLRERQIINANRRRPLVENTDHAKASVLDVKALADAVGAPEEAIVDVFAEDHDGVELVVGLSVPAGSVAKGNVEHAEEIAEA